MADLKLRFLSALILGPLVLLIAWWGGLPYLGLVILAGIGFTWEWFQITGSKGLSLSTGIGVLAMILAGVLFHFGMPGEALLEILAAAILFWALNGGAQSGRWGAEGIIYAGVSLLALLAARQVDDEGIFLFFLIIVVWSTDICAYFVGRFVGGPKLWRRVSPNKTWSGSIGGLVFAVVFAAIFIMALQQAHVSRWLLFAAILSVTAQAGDLMESSLKRRFDVKDSSKLIPGHGGIMDRIDGLVAAAIMAALLGLIMGGSGQNPMAGLGLI